MKKEDLRFLHERSLERWLECHTLDYSLVTDKDGEEKNVLAISVSELDGEVAQCEKWINDLTVPAGMGEYDTAAFADRYMRRKDELRLRIKAIQTVKQRIKSNCLNYVIRIERQLDGQRRSRSFLEQCQNEVNNYFKAHAESVYKKLQRASQLIDSDDPENLSLLLTQVRRAIKAAADHFYPAVDGIVQCADGMERELGDTHYLNRLQEYLATAFRKSTSQELLQTEYQHLAAFARRLNAVSAKGVHADVHANEAKQGLIGLYLFLYNVVSRVQTGADPLRR